MIIQSIVFPLSRLRLRLVSSPRAKSIRPFTSTPLRPVKYRRFGEPPRSITSRTPVPRQYQEESDPKVALINLLKSRYYPRRGISRPPVLILVLASGSILYYVAHLERVEGTGRLRFMDVNPSLEKSMADRSLQEVLNEYRNAILPASDRTSVFVKDVANRIIRASNLKGDWEVFIVKDDNNRNAFVLPGAKIFVFTGILPVTKDADGLAVVLGHEIAHQVARHSAERLSSMKVLFVISLVLSSVGFDIGLSRMLLNLVMTLPNSRTAESEADYIGLELATRACFNPYAAKGLWNRMESMEGGAGGSVDFLSTHPASSKRAKVLDELADEMVKKRPQICGAPLRREVEQFSKVRERRW